MPAAVPAVEVQARNNVCFSGNPAGRTIVFVHGFGCSQEMWRLLTPAFTDSFSVVVLDQVGSGKSDLAAYDYGKYDSLHGYADDLLAVLDAYDLRDVVVVGHSVGGIIAVLASVRAAARFGALVLVSPSPRYLDAEGYAGGFSQTDIDGLLDGLDANYFGWSAAMAPVIMGNADRPELAEELNDSFCRADPKIARHFARVTFLSDNRRDLTKVAVPTLVLQCRDDAIAPQAVGQHVHQAIPGSRLALVNASGHCPNLSHPDLVATEIKAFLAC